MITRKISEKINDKTGHNNVVTISISLCLQMK